MRDALKISWISSTTLKCKITKATTDHALSYNYSASLQYYYYTSAKLKSRWLLQRASRCICAPFPTERAKGRLNAQTFVTEVFVQRLNTAASCFRCSFHRWSLSEPVGQSFTDHWAKQKCRVRCGYEYLAQLVLLCLSTAMRELHLTSKHSRKTLIDGACLWFEDH